MIKILCTRTELNRSNKSPNHYHPYAALFVDDESKLEVI
jgi:hypothetical protein